MKQAFTVPVFKNIFKQLFAPFVLFIILLNPHPVFAQADSTLTDSTKAVEVVEEESGLISPAVDFISVQKGDNSIDLKAVLRAKVKGAQIKLPLLKITFVQVTEAGDRELGFVITDRNGKAVFNAKVDSSIKDKEGKLLFKALFAGNKAMEAAEAEVTIKRARLVVTPVKGDSLLTLQVKLVDIATGTETPVPETVLGIFVNRLFYPLKVGEGTTDENGEATIEIPNNLPGDKAGNITLLAKLDESELYGNLETSVTQKWGVPVSELIKEQPRELWSAHPPIWMIVTFIILMTVVWGHYFVIIYELIRLRKEEPHPPLKAIS